MAVTEGIGFRAGNREGGVKMNFIDVSRAYFHARVRRDVYVNLPQEDSAPGMCGKLLKAMYGTRDAAQNWECEYVEFLKQLGFKQGRATPCVFTLTKRGLTLVVHGDDFVISGQTIASDWFREQIKQKFEVKFRGRPGPEEGDNKSIRILNRVLEWSRDGITYKADQRHAEIIVPQLVLTAPPSR